MAVAIARKKVSRDRKGPTRVPIQALVLKSTEVAERCKLVWE